MCIIAQTTDNGELEVGKNWLILRNNERVNYLGGQPRTLKSSVTSFVNLMVTAIKRANLFYKQNESYSLCQSANDKDICLSSLITHISVSTPFILLILKDSEVALS